MPTNTQHAYRPRRSHTGQRVASLEVPKAGPLGAVVGGGGGYVIGPRYAYTSYPYSGLGALGSARPTVTEIASYARSQVQGAIALNGLDAMPPTPSAMATYPSNEIGAYYRIAYFTAIASRMAYQRSEYMQAAVLAKDASGALAKAELYAKTRYTPPGQIYDVGKTASAGEIANLLTEAAASIAVVPGLASVSAALQKLAVPSKIEEAMKQAGEQPGVRMPENVIENLLPDVEDPSGKLAIIGAGVAVTAYLAYLALTPSPKKRKNGRKPFRMNGAKDTLAPFVALGTIAFGATLIAFPDPAPFVGPSTLIGAPLLLGGLYYFGIEEKPSRRRNRRNGGGRYWTRSSGRRPPQLSYVRRSVRKGRGGFGS